MKDHFTNVLVSARRPCKWAFKIFPSSANFWFDADTTKAIFLVLGGFNRFRKAVISFLEMYSPLNVTWRPVFPEFGTGYLYYQHWPGPDLPQLCKKYLLEIDRLWWLVHCCRISTVKSLSPLPYFWNVYAVLLPKSFLICTVRGVWYWRLGRRLNPKQHLLLICYVFRKISSAKCMHI